MRFIQSAGTTVLFKVVSLAFGLAVSILIGRVLGAEGRGIYGLVMTVVVLSSSFGVFGFGAANTYFIARDTTLSRRAGFQSIVVGLIGAIAAAAIVFAFIKFAPAALRGLDGMTLAATLLLVLVFLWGNLFSRAFLGLGNIVAFNSFDAAGRVIFFGVGLVSLLWMNDNIESYMLLVSLCMIGFVAVYIYSYFQTSTSGAGTLSELMSKSLGYGIRPYLAAIFTWITIRSGIFFVNHFNSTSDAGLFSVAQQLSELLVVVPSVVGSVLFPRVAGGESKDLTARVLRTMLATFFPLVVLLAVFAEPIISLLYGPEFIASGEVLLILLPGAFLLGLEVIIANDIAGRGYPWPAALVWIPIFVLNAVGYYVLIPMFGINGAALAATVTFAIVFVFMAIYLKKLSGFSLSEMFLPRLADFRTVLVSAKQFLGSESGSNDRAKPRE